MFAIEAVVDIAYHAAVTPVQSKGIAMCQDIPRCYLEQVLQQLAREGVLCAVRVAAIGWRRSGGASAWDRHAYRGGHGGQ